MTEVDQIVARIVEGNQTSAPTRKSDGRFTMDDVLYVLADALKKERAYHAEKLAELRAEMRGDRT